MAAGKIILSVMVSVDGYACAINGSTSLLRQYYQEFVPAGVELLAPKDCGAVLLGRKAYEQYGDEVKKLAGSGMQLIVATRTKLQTPKSLILVKGDLKQAWQRIQKRLQCNLWVLGGPDVINQLSSVNALDEIRLTTVPVQLGGGIPLFDPDLQRPEMTLQKLEQYGGLTYSVWQKK
ncbi:dihydrofolate reductase [Ligilactobacillus salitolerans]|uniref:Dihydrofolate reductase n=1 Tax=Ligilactobacillus salitolerans TaxID=1808352 RepID=A0A401IS17_9LACO|nr:dihydrofolate reductase family protein [Ligilactobacillus salitolerans]GBG94333.1 dihydrofolate reductase [Ligilactobacillus salitolerans]